MDIFCFCKRQTIIATFITVGCCILMVSFPDVALQSSRKAIALWLTDILPALLPFFICANFLQNIGIISYLRTGIFPFAMSVLSGYPMGSKIVGDLKRDGVISLNEGKRLMSFCSTSGPAFIVGAVGAGMMGSGTLGAIMALAHYGGALANGVLFSCFYKDDKQIISNVRKTTANNIQEDFTDALLMSLKSLGIILCYIVLFMFAAELMNIVGLLDIVDSKAANAMIKGIMEMTVGCEAVSGINDITDIAKCTLASFVISWGGLSVLGQTMSMLSSTGISLKYIVLTKFTHGLFSAAIAFVIGVFVL